MTTFLQGKAGPYEIIDWVEQQKVAIGKNPHALISWFFAAY